MIKQFRLNKLKLKWRKVNFDRKISAQVFSMRDEDFFLGFYVTQISSQFQKQQPKRSNKIKLHF